MTMTFGGWLKAKRGRRGDPGFISQGVLARRMGVTRPFVGQIEVADSLPTYPTRQKVHAALDTSESELIELGIVRAHVINVPTATAQAAAHTPTVIVSRTKAFFESLTEEQRRMLIETIREGEANARAADEREAERERASGE